jgi:DNA-binding PadR family transcriptional regulator
LENYQTIFEEIKKSGRPMTLFALTDKGYANLGENLSSIRAFIEQQKAIIVAYENYYKESSKAIEDANKEITKSQEEVKKSVEPSPAFSFKGLFK